MMVGQKFVVKNDDPFLHNVHGLPSDNAPFNFGQPNKDPGKDIGAFKKTENFRVKCDVHPWMGMNIAVFDHPYFATSGDDGTFTPPAAAGGHLYAHILAREVWHAGKRSGCRSRQEGGTEHQFQPVILQ